MANTLSIDVQDWVRQNQSELKKHVANSPLKKKSDVEFLKEIINSPKVLGEAWRELQGAMVALKAPAKVVADAKAASGAITFSEFPPKEKAELTAVAEPLLKARTDAERLDIIDKANAAGKLSKELAGDLLQFNSAAGGSRLLPPGYASPMSWRGCAVGGFIGCCGGGPLGALAGCALCAAFC